ncbi:MAG: ABC transporter permease [Dermatophilaceae bacterium]
MNGPAPILRIECRKLFTSPLARTAALAVLLLATATSAGGYAAATQAPESDVGRKVTAMITGPGWGGYLDLAALSSGTTLLLAAGIVIAWAVGREFTEGTIVGLFAIAASRASVARAKLLACGAWGGTLILVQSTASVLAGVGLGLSAEGALHAWLTMVVSGSCLLCSVLPIAWVATREQGYLAGIGATLATLMITNLAAGFGTGGYLPWAIPTLWASLDSTVPAAALAIPLAVGLLGVWATTRSWSRLQLGRS